MKEQILIGILLLSVATLIIRMSVLDQKVKILEGCESRTNERLNRLERK